jgi:hypothetical protein
MVGTILNLRAEMVTLEMTDAILGMRASPIAGTIKDIMIEKWIVGILKIFEILIWILIVGMRVWGRIEMVALQMLEMITGLIDGMTTDLIGQVIERWKGRGG